MNERIIELQRIKSEFADHQGKINDVVNSQEFVTRKYDDYEKEHNDMKNTINDLKSKVETNVSEIQTHGNKIQKQEAKTEHMFTYSRQDHVCFSGVPFCRGPDGAENCKQMIINICRELHYNIPPNEISTAHRLKAPHDRLQPPGIIVRFKDRDIRRDVLGLKHQLRGKTYWSLYGITKLYINEQLTPDKRRLMYQTKVFIREMDRIYGKIFVWTYKGDIYIRKDEWNAPKRKISAEEDLIKIKQGLISLNGDKTIVRSPKRAYQNHRKGPIGRRAENYATPRELGYPLTEAFE